MEQINYDDPCDPICQYDVVIDRHPKVPNNGHFPYKVPKSTWCWWDKHPIDSGIAVSCVTSSDGPKRYNFEGLFCCWDCSIAYGREHPRSDYVRRACETLTRRFLRDTNQGHIITGGPSEKEKKLGITTVQRPLEEKERKLGNVIERYPLKHADHWSTLKEFNPNGDGLDIKAFRKKGQHVDIQTYWSERGPMYVHDLEITCSFRPATTVYEIVKHGDLDYIPPTFPLDLSAMVRQAEESQPEETRNVNGIFIKKEKKPTWQHQPGNKAKRKKDNIDPALATKRLRQHELGQKRVFRLKQTRLVQHETVVGAGGSNSLAKFMVKSSMPSSSSSMMPSLVTKIKTEK